MTAISDYARKSVTFDRNQRSSSANTHSALDRETIGEVLNVIKVLADNGMTMLVVTQEMSFAHRVGDRFAAFDAGRIVNEALGTDLRLAGEGAHAGVLSHLRQRALSWANRWCENPRTSLR